jgi:hypothetical protein
LRPDPATISRKRLPLATRRKTFIESFGAEVQPHGPGSLAERFIAPPFSVLLAEQEYWTEEQTRWIPVFDPVLCEVIYGWFAPTKEKGLGHIFDPFATDSTRGIVAGCLGYNYTGIERSAKKIAAYERQAILVRPKYPDMKTPKWICADPVSMDKHLPRVEQYDLIFTDLPIYNPKQATSQCMARYEKIFRQAIARLKQNRCVVVVARTVRGEDGFIQFAPEEVVGMMSTVGLPHYNRMVLVMSGNTHEMVYQFWHGEADDKAIPRELGVLDCIPR